MEFTNEGVNNVALFMRKASEIYNLFDMTNALKQVESRIAIMQGANNEDVSLSCKLQIMRMCLFPPIY